MPFRSGSMFSLIRRERRAAERTGHPADVQPVRARHQRRAADREVVRHVEVGRPLVAARGAGRRATWKSLAGAPSARTCCRAIAVGVRHLRAVVVAEALLHLQHERVVVDLPGVDDLAHRGGERHEARVLRPAARPSPRSASLLPIRTGVERPPPSSSADSGFRFSVISMSRPASGRSRR